jgi:hypothetical protein
VPMSASASSSSSSGMSSTRTSVSSTKLKGCDSLRLPRDQSPIRVRRRSRSRGQGFPVFCCANNMHENGGSNMLRWRLFSSFVHDDNVPKAEAGIYICVTAPGIAAVAASSCLRDEHSRLTERYICSKLAID